jgi:hypothetical protein
VPRAPTIELFDLHLLDMRAVWDHDSCKVDGRRGGVDRALKSALTSFGSSPEWSIWAWLSTTDAIREGLKGKGR